MNLRQNNHFDIQNKYKYKEEVIKLFQLKNSQTIFSQRQEKNEKKEPLKQHTQIKMYQQQLPDIKEGITLDKYFGCNFTVVDQESFKFNEEFGGITRKYISETDSLNKYLEDDFEINEIDEDTYTESNFECISNKNSKNQKRSKNKKRLKSPIEQNSIGKNENQNQYNNDIQLKIMNKYQKKKNKSIHKYPDDNIRISIKIDYPQQPLQSQFQTKNQQAYQLTQEKFKENIKEDCSNTLTSFTQSLNRQQSNSIEKTVKNNDSFEVDNESHIVLRNSSSNIFRYSNYNKKVDDSQIYNYQQTKKINKNQDQPLTNMPRIYYDNVSIENKYFKQKQGIDKKIQHQDQLILDKYAHRFNLNQQECNSISDIKSYRFQSLDKYKRQQEFQ